MGLFNTLMTNIFGLATSRPASTPPAAGGGAPGAGTGSGSQTSTAAPAAAPVQQVDIAATLNGLAAKNSEKLDWKHSIVDLMKLVGMDSSLSARKELATDLKYTGDQNDSATMNMWLHKEVLKKLSENGGHVPAELLSR